jgi:hypothetical protein
LDGSDLGPIETDLLEYSGDGLWENGMKKKIC